MRNMMLGFGLAAALCAAPGVTWADESGDAEQPHLFDDLNANQISDSAENAAPVVTTEGGVQYIELAPTPDDELTDDGTPINSETGGDGGA